MAVTCPECAAEVAPDARFCASCGARQPERIAAPAREVRKVVTVLFADVTGSTALGEQLDPETLRALMGRYFARIRQVIEAHGGTVEKFIGDAVMAVFGIPVVHEDDALRAVRAAWEIRDALAALNAELEAAHGPTVRFRTGINTGEVVAGEPGSGTTLVTGDTVNTAARLEQAAPPGEILLGRLTWSLARDAVDAEPVPPIEAKGKAEPLEAFRLLAVRTGSEGRARHLDAPLVGRDRELERVTAAYRSVVADRACALFTLLGSAGVGKSRLTAEFVASVAGEAIILRGRCLSYGEGITYWPIGEIVRSAAGITEADDAEEAGARVRALLGDLRDADTIADRIAAAIGLSTTPAPKEEVAWAVRRLFEHLAEDRPVVVVVEDIHWAEPTLLELIEHVADWTRDAAVFLLCPARPELLDGHPAWGGGKFNATTLLLEPLPTDATARLIDALPGGAALPESVVQRVMAAAEGNPLYLEELLGMLVDDGLLAQSDDGTWRPTRSLDDIHVPPSVSLLLVARLERLPPEERRVAERASVVGRVFEQAAVVELAPAEARTAVPAALLALVRKELLRPDRGDLLTAGEAFKFRHVLIRDAAYEALPKAERATLHERVADWLEGVAGDRLTEIEEIIGYHLAQAHRYRVELGDAGDALQALADRAATHLTAAGLRAEQREDSVTAIALLEHAVRLRGAGTHDTDLLRIKVANAMWLVGRVDDGIEVAEAVLAGAIARGDAQVHARAMTTLLGLRAEAKVLARTSAEFGLMLDEAQRVVEAAGDDLASAQLWRNRGTYEWDHGRWGPSGAALVTALAHAERAGDEREVDELRMSMLVSHLSGPMPLTNVLDLFDRMLERGDCTRVLAGQLLARRGLIRGMLELAGAEEDALHAQELHIDLGQRTYAAEAVWHRSWIARLADDYRREADLLLAAAGDAVPDLVPFLLASRAFALAKLGDHVDALDTLSHAEGDAWYRTGRLRKLILARLGAVDGRTAEALEIASALEAEVDAEGQAPFLNARAEVLIETGVIAALAGDEASARRRAAAALETATRKESRALERKAGALLAGKIECL